MYYSYYYPGMMGQNFNFKNPNNLGKVTMFSLIRKINWNGVLNNTSKTLNIINQAIPIVNQVKPLANNMKTMFKIANIMREDQNKYKKNDIHNNCNNNSNINTSNINQPTFFE